MNEQELAEVVQAIAGEAIPASTDLWPAVVNRLQEDLAQPGGSRLDLRGRALLMPQVGVAAFVCLLFLVLGTGLLLISWALYTQWTAVERFIAVHRGEEHFQQVGWLLHKTAEESAVRPVVAAVVFLLGVTVIVYGVYSSSGRRLRTANKVMSRRNK